VAGGGYLTSNEQTYVFHVPSGEMIEELQVTWPNNDVQSWNVSPAKREIVLIEGRELLSLDVDSAGGMSFADETKNR
jgi:hypothetical protein